MPTIHLIGLPGSGKTTLANSLLNWLGWQRSFRIGSYHKRFAPTTEGDQAAWEAMLRDMERERWTQFIFESTGLNSRWERVIEQCGGREHVATLKLICGLPALKARIAQKSTEDQAHGDWLPPDRFRSKAEMVEALYDEFQRIASDAVFDTEFQAPQAILENAKKFLRTRGMTPER